MRRNVVFVLLCVCLVMLVLAVATREPAEVLPGTYQVLPGGVSVLVEDGVGKTPDWENREASYDLRPLLTTTSERIYWRSEDKIYSARKSDGGDRKVVYTIEEGTRGLLADDNAVYFTAEFSVYRVAHGSDDIQELAKQGDEDEMGRVYIPDLMIADDTYIYWTSKYGGTDGTPFGIWRVPKDGGKRQTVQFRRARPDLVMTIEDGYLYYGRSVGSVERVTLLERRKQEKKKGSKKKPQRVTIVRNEHAGGIVDVAATKAEDNTYIYWAAYCCGLSMTTPYRSEHNVINIVPKGERISGRSRFDGRQYSIPALSVQSIDTDETYLYWVTPDGQFARRAHGKSSETELILDLGPRASLDRLVVDGPHAFITTDEGAILSVDLDRASSH